MDLSEYVSLAVKSADTYLDYCLRMHKCVQQTPVCRVAVTEEPNVFQLVLDNIRNKPRFDDSIFQIVLDPGNYLPDEYYLEKSVSYIKKEYFHLDSFDEKKSLLTVTILDDRLIPLFSDYLTSHPFRLKLIDDMTFLVRQVKEWYEKYGMSIQLPPTPEPVTVESEFNDSTLSESQKEAVETALSSPVSYIWGPPGTGKTQSLAHAVIHYVRNCQDVLIVSPTNNAIDQSLTTIIKVMQQYDMDINTVCRLGTPSSRINSVLSESRQKLLAQIEELKQQIALLRALLDENNRLLEKMDKRIIFNSKSSEFYRLKDEYLSAVHHAEEYEKKLTDHQEEMRITQDRMKNLKSKMQAAHSEIKSMEAEEQNVGYKLKSVFNSSYAKQHREALASKHSEVKKMSSQLDAVIQQYKAQKEMLGRLESEKEASCESVEEITSKISEISVFLFSDYISVSHTEALIIEKEEEYSSLPDRASTEANHFSFEEKLRECESELCKLKDRAESKCEPIYVYACTIDYLFNNYTLPFKEKTKEHDPPFAHFAHIFVDEAALLPLIKVGIVFSYGAPVTLCGDHKQLPPICEMDEKEIDFEENRSVFLWSQSSLHFCDIFTNSFDEMYSVFAASGDFLNHIMNISFLTKTYRFGQNLARILDEYVYDHRGFSGIEKDTRITVIDAPYQKGNVRWQNDQEASALTAYLSDHKLDNAVVLTPYKKQLALLRSSLNRLIRQDRIMTVHSSQGREWDTVIFSPVDRNQKFLCNSQKPQGIHVINTAVSRSINDLVIVCDFDYWRDRSDSQLIGRLVSEYSELVRNTPPDETDSSILI